MSPFERKRLLYYAICGFFVVAAGFRLHCICRFKSLTVELVTVPEMTSCTHICRSILFEKLSSNADPGIPIPEELVVHRDYVFSLLKSTVQSGENNSALIIGPRGSGKTKVYIHFFIFSYWYIVIIYMCFLFPYTGDKQCTCRIGKCP